MLAQLVAKRQWVHALRLRRILDLETMFVGACHEMDEPLGVGDLGVSRKDICNHQRVQVSNVGGCTPNA